MITITDESVTIEGLNAVVFGDKEPFINVMSSNLKVSIENNMVRGFPRKMRFLERIKAAYWFFKRLPKY